MTDEQIAERIKQARIERGFTQKDLAQHLRKTPSNVSDIERCRVQVSALDLYKIADALNKPIEYFYGETFGDPEIEDMIALLRNQSPEAVKQSLKTVRALLNMQQLRQNVEVSNRELTPTEAQQFMADFLGFLMQFDQLRKQVDEARAQFMQVLAEQGIDLASLMGGST